MNRDYFKDENHDNFDEYDDQRSFMYKLKVMEELGLDGSEESFCGSDQNDY